MKFRKQPYSPTEYRCDTCGKILERYHSLYGPELIVHDIRTCIRAVEEAAFRHATDNATAIGKMRVAHDKDDQVLHERIDYWHEEFSNKIEALHMRLAALEKRRR